MKTLLAIIAILAALTAPAPAGPSNTPTCSIVLMPADVTVNEVFTASWSSNRAQTLELFANGASLGPVSINSGSKQFVAVRTTEYSLKASHHQHGTGWCYATLNVREPPPQSPDPSCTLSASPATIEQGATTTVAWTTQHAVTFEVIAVTSEGSSAMVVEGASGSIVRQPALDTTYNGTVTNDQGATATCTAAVTVTKPAPAPVCSVSLWPLEVAYGGDVTLTWSSQHATKLEAWSIAQADGAGNYLGLLEPAVGGSRVYSAYQTGHVHAEVYNAAGANANCATSPVKVGAPPQPVAGYLLDDKGAYLLTNPTSTPPNDKLTDLIAVVLKPKGAR